MVDQQLWEKEREFSTRNHFAVYNGMRMTELEPDRAVFCMDIRPESCNPLEIVHGGALFAMADCAGGMAVRTDGRSYVTQNASINFLRAQSQGQVRAEAVVRRRGKTTCLVAVDISDDQGRLTATGTFTFYCVGNGT